MDDLKKGVQLARKAESYLDFLQMVDADKKSADDKCDWCARGKACMVNH